jgi:hypothetical protein
MDTLYQKLNQKLDTLIKQQQQSQTKYNHTGNAGAQTRLINLTNITFSKEHSHILTLGPNYALTRDPKDYMNELIIDTENAIRQLEPKVQGAFRHMAATKIKQIKADNTRHTLHKRCQYNIRQIKHILRQNNLTIVRADKNKAIIIINKATLDQKILTFINENRITHLNKDPTDQFQKQIQQVLQKCNTLIDKNKIKYLMNIKPTAPKLNAYIKTHKRDEPIRPVINSIQAPTYKLAKYLNNKLQTLIQLPNTYTIKNSHELARELHSTHINENDKLITLDIKDLYVHLPIKNILRITKFWLRKHNHHAIVMEQILCLL